MGVNKQKYPISHNLGCPELSEFFYRVLTFHIPPKDTPSILDPTCGKKLLWKHFFRRSLTDRRLIDKYNVTFSDIRDLGQGLVCSIDELKFNSEFDGIIYDPPYFFGYEGSNDRVEEYGDYGQDYTTLLNFMRSANNKFPSLLKPKSKLIVKCADMYHVKRRRFYPLHILWVKKLSNFNLIDVFIYFYRHRSPTSFQVKNRPCSIIQHTYFLVFELKE